MDSEAVFLGILTCGVEQGAVGIQVSGAGVRGPALRTAGAVGSGAGGTGSCPVSSPGPMVSPSDLTSPSHAFLVL